jgi:hypothetical protein
MSPDDIDFVRLVNNPQNYFGFGGLISGLRDGFGGSIDWAAGAVLTLGFIWICRF